MNPEYVVSEIDNQIRMLIDIRAMFPYTTTEAIGQRFLQTAPFYQQRGFLVQFQFDEPLTEQRIEENNGIGHWVNQNFVLRLYAILESNGVIPKEGEGKIKTEIDGHEEVDIIRRLRRQFAHTSGRYNSKDPEERRLYQRIVERYRIQTDPAEEGRLYPVPIDKLLLPLAEGSKKYARGLANYSEKG